MARKGGSRGGLALWGFALVVAALTLGYEAVRNLLELAPRSRAAESAADARLAAAYEGYWRELELRAAGAAHDLAAAPEALDDPQRAFEILERGTRPARIA